MDKPQNQYTENDWLEYYRQKGEHVALVDLAGEKIEEARWLGAQKFTVMENNRRHMEPIIEASKSRKVAWLSLVIAVLALIVSTMATVAAFLTLR